MKKMITIAAVAAALACVACNKSSITPEAPDNNFSYSNPTGSAMMAGYITIDSFKPGTLQVQYTQGTVGSYKYCTDNYTLPKGDTTIVIKGTSRLIMSGHTTNSATVDFWWGLYKSGASSPADKREIHLDIVGAGSFSCNYEANMGKFYYCTELHQD